MADETYFEGHSGAATAFPIDFYRGNTTKDGGKRHEQIIEEVFKQLY
jgi:hypothetical protein